MVRGSPRTFFTGSALVRLLTQWTEAPAAASKQAVGERLSQWLGWTDAIALSAALSATPTVARSPRSTAPARSAGPAKGGFEADVARVRTALTRSITDDARPADAGEDFAPYRRHYLGKQQAMELGIEPVRERLRAALAQRSTAMARLAGVDAVMDDAVGTQARALLSAVPSLLEKRFERLRAQHRARVDEANDEPEAASGPAGWLDVFCKDLQRALLAELDLRLQPLEGLLEALRKTTP